MGNRTLVRSDGSLLVVPEADAPRLLTLGYREQSATEQLEAGIGRGIENYYTTPGQQFQTAVEGGLSGLSLGLTDLLGGEQEQERARYNPGTRIASEIVGGLIPLAPGALGAAARAVTPAGLLTRGAAAAGEALGAGSKVIKAATQAGIEGAGFGAGAALTNAQLDGQPITAEAIMAGMGWGALFGGGLGAAGGAIEAKMEARAARKLAAEEAQFLKHGAHEATVAERALAEAKAHQVKAEWVKESGENFLQDEAWNRVDITMRDAASELKAVKQAVVDSSPLPFRDLKNTQFAIRSQMNENYLMKDAKRFFDKGQIDIAQAMSAASEGKYEKMVSKLEGYKDKMVAMETSLGGPKFFNSEKAVKQANDLIGLAKFRLESGVAAAEEAVGAAAAHAALSKFPHTVGEFVAMKSNTVEELVAGIDRLGKLKSAEIASVQQAVGDAIDWMGKSMGITIEGGSKGTQLREMWKQLKTARSAQTQAELKMASEGNLLWKKADKAAENAEAARTRGEQAKAAFKSKSAAQRGAETALRYGAGTWAAHKLGTPGYILGSALASGLIGMKGAVLGTIADKAANWLPKAARGMQKYGSRVEPLLTRLDGREEQGSKDRQELMAARSKEIAQAAPGIRDTMFRAVEPLNMKHPELAQQLHIQAIQRFQFILSKMPKDPGLAYSNLKSLWKPDAVAIEKFARYYEVFQNPVAVMTKALETGKITMEAADGLKNMNPEMWTYLRGHLLERVSDPKVRKDMKYEDQVQMGMMLDIPMHSTMTPQFIAAQQQMFTERNKPLEMNPRIQTGGGGGRPAGPGPAATSAQRITEH